MSIEDSYSVIAYKYFEAWNRHDALAIVETFAADGTYQDPATGQKLTGQAISDYASSTFAAFPDLLFDITNLVSTGDGKVAVQWMMRGKNTGSIAGNPPTGNEIMLSGADFITIADGLIHSVEGYFDQKTFLEQLGLQVIAQPKTVGNLQFGTSVYMSTGKTIRPGALSLTWIDVRSEEEAQTVSEYSRQTLKDMQKMSGFISFMGAQVGYRLFTITAWSDPESSRQLMRGGAHKQAAQMVFSSNFGEALFTSVWVPSRFNSLWVNCPVCGLRTDYDRSVGKCQNGHDLSTQKTYL